MQKQILMNEKAESMKKRKGQHGTFVDFQKKYPMN
jgi:hypothetical protein